MRVGWLLWLLWLLASLASFLALEAVALLDRTPENTLSATVRRLLAWRPWVYGVALAGWLSGLAVLTVHWWT